MKKYISILLAACLILPACATNVPRKMEKSAVLLHMKVHLDPVKIEVEEDNDSADVKHITTEGRDGWGTCSGVYIKDNIILSAAHCVDMQKNMHLKEIWVRKGDQTERAVVVKIDPKADLVLLYTPLRGTPVKFAWRVVRGEECWVIGNPLGLPNIITKGIVSQVGLANKDEKAVFIVVDAIVLPGNSGGPVVNSDGRLIGILTRSTSFFGPFGASGLGLAVDLRTILEFLNSK